jgi:PAS domain-containing protein
MADRGASERHGITAEAELRLLAAYCTDVIARVGADMTFSYFSPSAERMFRRPVSEIIGSVVTLTDSWHTEANAVSCRAQARPAADFHAAMALGR